VTDVRLQIAHQAVENTHHLDTAREKGKTHLDDPPQDFTFDDFIDIINPLQHLPLVSTIYRAITGDTIKPAMRILGDIGYGGPTGFLSSCAQVLFEAIFGDDVGGTVISMITGEDKKSPAPQTAQTPAGSPVQLAATDPAAPQTEPNKTAATAAYAMFTKALGTNR